MMARFSFDPARPYDERRDPSLPDDVRALALACFAAEQRAAEGIVRARASTSAVSADACAAVPTPASSVASADVPAVSAAALDELLARGARVGGIVTQRELATAIPFNVRLADDVVQSRALAVQRRRLDAALGRWIGSLFDAPRVPVLRPAGQWWYPPGTWFGWHTNEAYPGWRLYLSHAEEPDASFFRYRDPSSGVITTSSDGRWHLRFFAVSRERPLWHAIASSTNRFSLGWHVRPWTLREAAVARVASVVGR